MFEYSLRFVFFLNKLGSTRKKSHFEVKGCWNGPCLGFTGKRCAKRMLILLKGRATVDLNRLKKMTLSKYEGALNMDLA